MRIVSNSAKPSAKRCTGKSLAPSGQKVQCLNRMTYAEQQKQYFRLNKADFLSEQTKSIMPLCQKCMTRYLRDFLKGTP